MKIAFIYDRITKWGGAERVLLALHEIWPEAPLYTAVYDRKQAKWADVFQVKPSFLQRIPGANKHHEWYPWLTPIAFESFDLDAFDVVISITSAEAKYVITKPETLHICYCLTPTRYLWSGRGEYQARPSTGLSAVSKLAYRVLAPVLRRWDAISSQRPDHYIAISKHVGERIRRYYKRKVDAVVYPPIADIFSKKVDAVSVSGQKKRDMYYLAVGRLVGYKRMDIVIAACNTLKLPLVVIGSGHEEASLRKLAGPTIQLVTRHLTDEELVGYYEGCHALLYGGDEDFGLVAAEALACHVPVVAYKKSGVSEIIDEGKTGIFFEEKTSASLEAAIKSLDKLHYDHDQCVRRVHEFSIDIFQKQIKKTVEDLNKRRTR